MQLALLLMPVLGLMLFVLLLAPLVALVLFVLFLVPVLALGLYRLLLILLLEHVHAYTCACPLLLLDLHAPTFFYL